MDDVSSHGRELLDFVDDAPTTRTLDDSEVLVRQHEAGTDVYVVLDGALDAVIETDESQATVAQFEPGQLFGELTALSGGPRTATVRSNGSSTVAVIAGADFARWLDAHPDREQAVAQQARDRVDRNRAAAMLAQVLGSDEPDLLAEVLPMVQFRLIEPGEILFHEGDPADAAYLVLSGRLRVTGSHVLAPATAVELGRNQIVGELGVLDRLPRTATVTAMRRSSLAALPADAVDRIVESNPQIGIHLFRQALGRALAPPDRSDVAHVVMINPTADVDATWIQQVALDELGRFGRVAQITARDIDDRLGREGVASAPPESVNASRVNELLTDLESAHDLLLLVGDGDATEWTVRAANTADRSLVLSSSFPTTIERERIAALDAALAGREIPWWRGVIHPSDTENPANHDPSVTNAERVLHGRLGHEGDLRRMVRLVSGNGIGLALGGGGARGFGHLGAYRAMLEAGIEPDVICGSSIGSVAGVPIALDWSTEQQLRFVHEGFDDLLDWTVPIVSFLKGERITGAIDRYLSEYRCEAMWRPYSCVVTNITRSQVEVRAEGPVNVAVRTSVSIPGVLPPMAKDGEVYVDGGVLNNLPADVVAADSAVSTVIAIDVAPPKGPSVEDTTEPVVSGLAMLAARARKRRIESPGAAAIVMQTMVAGSSQTRRRLIDDGMIDHYLHLTIKGSSLLAFDNIDPVIEQGYESAKAQLAEMEIGQRSSS